MHDETEAIAALAAELGLQAGLQFPASTHPATPLAQLPRTSPRLVGPGDPL